MNFKIQKYSQDYLFNNADSVDLEASNPEPIPISELAVETVSSSPDIDFLSNVKAQVGTDQPVTMWDPNDEEAEEPLAGFTNTVNYSSDPTSNEPLELSSVAIPGELFVSDNKVFVYSEGWKEAGSQDELASIVNQDTSELQE